MFSEAASSTPAEYSHDYSLLESVFHRFDILEVLVFRKASEFQESHLVCNFGVSTVIKFSISKEFLLRYDGEQNWKETVRSIASQVPMFSLLSE